MPQILLFISSGDIVVFCNPQVGFESDRVKSMSTYGNQLFQ